MLNLERKKQMMAMLEQSKSLTVKELAAALYVSEATVRRDLTELEREGLLKRSFGGAVLNERFPDQLPLSLRAAERIQEKKRICARAASLIRPGDTVFLDASSTTYFLTPYFRDTAEVTVVTNNPNVCIALAEYGVRCLCTGGELLSGSVALVGSEAERMIRGIRAHVCFFSARGVSAFASDSSKAERDCKIAMLENACRRYLLADRSKLGKEYPFRVADVRELDGIIDEEEKHIPSEAL